MEKKCGNVKAGETEGSRVDEKGEGLKEKCETVSKDCCGEDVRKKGFSSAAGPARNLAC